MITIVNISKKYSIAGMQEYEIRINSTAIARFKYRTEGGLSKLLQSASLTVKKMNINNNPFEIKK